MFMWAREGLILKSKEGFLLVEVIVSLVIMQLIFLTLIPMTNMMYERMQERKQSLHAMITNYDAIIEYNNDGSKLSGDKRIENRYYSWRISKEYVCTIYEVKAGRKESCVKFR